jgi:LuxR family maltose regulon positive regulatory protein
VARPEPGGGWIADQSLTQHAAWVTVGQDERDPQRFWMSALEALRGTAAGAGLVGELSAAPDLDGWAVVERLLADLVPLPGRLWLIVDDLHELSSADARRQLELLIMRAPPGLRFVLATRHDVRLGLHRLRLEGELTELRAADLRFSGPEASELLAKADVSLTDPAVALLVERTEGWAAGLRLAALSLAGHPDPGRFAAEFSGSERMVAEYLLAEVLERQSDQARRLMLRTSVLERVSGELADLLTGGVGGEAVLQDLEEANAFTVSLDTERTWFRYHRLFAGPARSCSCTASRRAGWPGMASRSRPSAMRRRPRTGNWQPACSAPTGRASTWAASPPRCTRCWPGSRRPPSAASRCYPRWPPRMNWPKER